MFVLVGVGGGRWAGEMGGGGRLGGGERSGGA